LPRREGGKGTEITTLPAGQNLGQMEDVDYFRKKLLNSLNVPVSRLDPQGGGIMGIGRTSEVTRDEVKFTKFINRLRNKFSQIFDNALAIQLSLKGVCSREEWEEFKEFVYYDYKKDNNFTELREAEILRERLNTIGLIDPYIGRYYSAEWVKKNVLHMTDDEIEQMEKQIEEEGTAVGESLSNDGQETQQFANQQTPGAVQSQDNTQESGSTESVTPQLDSEVEKFALNINKK
jgi:hypothetical protein